MHRELDEEAFWKIIAVASIAGAILTWTIGPTSIAGYTLLVISVAVFARFIRLLVRKTFSVDLLMGVAGLATWIIGSYFEGFLVYSLYSVSEILEDYAEKYAEKKITSLKKLLPEKIRVKENNRIIEKPVDEASPGDIIVVRPGETVPVDGILVSDKGLFDTSMVTGESEPRLIRRGERVESGYTCIGELVLIRALKKPSESLLQLLVREAEKALAEKSRIQRLVERIAKPYTIIVLLIFTVAALIIPPYNALAILLAGCPSAFIIASAVSTTLTIALLARRGIIVRGGRVLENTAGAKVLVFDKTGTLTLGELEVVETYPGDGFDKNNLLALAGAAAKASIHPVSRSIAKYSDLSPLLAKEYPGRGVEALVDGRRVLLGSKEFLEEKGIRVSLSRCDGYRNVYVGIDQVFAGEICLEEKVDNSTRSVMEMLLRQGYRIVVASGDRVEHVRRIAETLGIREYYGNMSPRDKSRLVEELRRHGKVVMIGDGINDLEALARADVGVAVGRIDVVSSIADIVLEKVSKIPFTLRLSRRYMTSLVYAIIAAALVKLSVMLAGIMGMLPLWAIVGLGDDGTTLLTLIMISAILSTSKWFPKK